MKRPEEWFYQYGISHQNRINILIHKVCVPLIMFSLLLMVYSIPVPASFTNYSWLNWSSLLIVSSWLFYALIGMRVLGLMIVQGVLMYWGVLYVASSYNPLWIGGSIFVASWLLQFWGHKIEGLKPSFLEDLQFLLIGPAWVFRKLIGYR